MTLMQLLLLKAEGSYDVARLQWQLHHCSLIVIFQGGLCQTITVRKNRTLCRAWFLVVLHNVAIWIVFLKCLCKSDL